MRKTFLTTSIVSVALATSLYASGQTGPGTSKIYAGLDINGSAHAQKIASTTIDLNATGSNTKDNNTTRFITYVPDAEISDGNIITIKVNNGTISKKNLNKLWLVDANSTTESNATGGPVVASMGDFLLSAGNYEEMTFKFSSRVESGHHLILVDGFETNTTLKNDIDTRYGLGYRTTNLSLKAKQGLSCGDDVTLQVVKSKDQSSNWFNTQNTDGPSKTGIKVVKGVYVKHGVDGAGAVSSSSNYDGADYGSNDCPTFNCNISIKEGELAFGSSAGTNTNSCPTCSDTTDNTKDLTCTGSFLLKYNNSGILSGAGVTLSSIDVKTTANKATLGSLSKITGKLNTSTTKKSFTIESDKTNAKGSLTTGLLTTADNKVEIEYTADGNNKLVPTIFDLDVRVNGTAEVDKITGFMEFKEQGTPLTVSYLNGNANYRSFVRISVDKPATVQAVITDEYGVVSSRFDTGYKLDAANGGAVVVEATELLRKAKDDFGFTGAGYRFNATLYVKTTGDVDAVAYQNAGGSQRYLPVFGATGGGKK